MGVKRVYLCLMRPYKEWCVEGRCRTDPEAKEEFIQNSRKQKQYCIGCPVLNECFQYAILYEEHGVWGGATEAEREAIIKGSPLLQKIIRREAAQQGILEDRYSIVQYWETIQKAREIRRDQRYLQIQEESVPQQSEEEFLEPLEELSIPQEFEPETISL